MLASLTRKSAWILLGCTAGLTRAGASQRPAACQTSAQPDPHWSGIALAGLRLSLSLPGELRRLADSKLPKTAQRAAERSLFSGGGGEQLVAAWEAPGKAAGAIRQVLLYTAPGEPSSVGRPCALVIAAQPAFVFKVVLSDKTAVASEYWTVARWPGFVLALGGRSLDAYEVGFGILRSVAASP